MRRIFARISSNLPEKFCAGKVCLQIFSHKNHENIFWYDLKKGLHVISANVERHFLKSKTFRRHICPDFPELCSDFQRFCSDFRQIKISGSALVSQPPTPLSCSSVLNKASLNYFRQIFCSQVSHCRCYVFKHML